jgi:hypothetical protein
MTIATPSIHIIQPTALKPHHHISIYQHNHHPKPKEKAPPTQNPPKKPTSAIGPAITEDRYAVSSENQAIVAAHRENCRLEQVHFAVNRQVSFVLQNLEECLCMDRGMRRSFQSIEAIPRESPLAQQGH